MQESEADFLLENSRVFKLGKAKNIRNFFFFNLAMLLFTDLVV